MSTLAFDIIHFFPFLNYQLLSMILSKVGFDFFLKANIGVGQRSTLLLILLALYIVLIFYMFEKRSKNLLTSILFLILSFVNDRLFVSQEKSYKNLIQTFLL